VNRFRIDDDRFICPVRFENQHLGFDFRSFDSIESMIDALAILINEILSVKERALVFVKNNEMAELAEAAAGDESDRFTDTSRAAYTRFADKRCDVLITTEELGIGINLPDIQHVIHIGLPMSKNEYVQEIGRGGRDGNDVISHVFYISAEAAQIPPHLLEREVSVEEISLDLDRVDLLNDYAAVTQRFTEHWKSANELTQLLSETKTDIDQRTPDGAQNVVIPYIIQNGKLEVQKQLVYILYTTGCISDWYISKEGKAQTELVISIKDSVNALSRIKDTTVQMLISLGNDRKAIKRVENAKNIDGILAAYAEWHFWYMLYQQREQFIDMYSFIVGNEHSEANTITEQIKDYFELPFVELRRDEQYYSRLSVDQALLN